MAKRVTVYIDGFNFYYGLRTAKQVNAKWYKGYWIDLVKFSGNLSVRARSWQKSYISPPHHSTRRKADIKVLSSMPIGCLMVIGLKS